jgi:hypothetical protein
VYDAQEEHKEQMEELRKEYPLDQIGERWFNRGQPVVPDEEELKRNILHQYHDHGMAGHPRISNTITTIMREFWWPEIQQFTATYIRGCAICQSTKPNTTRPKPPMMPITHNQPQHPFQTIAMDLITDLPISRGYDSILAIVDHGCSKAAIFLPCHKAIDAVGVASLYAKRVFPFYSVPRKVISDQDPQFTAQFAKELCGALKIDQNLSMAYHLQTDGQSERANQRVEQYLQIYGNEEQNDWADLLLLAQFTHNAWPNESTGQTPFNLLIGHMPTLVITEKDTTIPEITKQKEWCHGSGSAYLNFLTVYNSPYNSHCPVSCAHASHDSTGSLVTACHEL